MKKTLKKLLFSNLGEPFYLNIVKFKIPNNDYNSKWFPIWLSKWSGSNCKSEAIKMRNEAQDWLQKNGNKSLTKDKFKTVKITRYNI
jgi:hypothetical protein